jgi:hypothetical protein
MGIIIKSNIEAWFNNSNEIDGRMRWAVDNLETAYEEAQKTVDIADRASEIGSLSLSVSNDELELLGENRRRLRSFAQGIHYEISERVDNRFSMQMSTTVDRAYALRPEDIQVHAGRILGVDITTNLLNVVLATFTDWDLASDFQSRVRALDNSEKSTELAQAILEAEFWQDQFRMAREIQEITEQIFTDEVRELWAGMTPEERVALMEQLMDESMAVMFADLPSNRTGELVFDARGKGVMRRGEGGSWWNFNIDEIGFNPSFRDIATGNYSVDAMIRVMVHEVRHSYQWQVRHGRGSFPDIPDSVQYDWRREYIALNGLPYPQGNFMAYYLQPVELDANAFAGLARPRISSIGGY